MTALLIEGLSHSFGKREALHQVSLAIGEGGFTILLGRNGAGKTTLFSLVTGLYHARQGSIRVFGYDMRLTPAAGLAEMGVVFQQPTLDLDLTALENLRYHGGLHGLPSRAAEDRACRELDRIGLRERARDLVRTLSGGQRRRVEIARALMHEPRLLLLDEPTTGLDIPGRRSLLSHVRHLCSEHGLAVLWATHLLEEVEDHDQLIVLDAGRVRWAGPAADMSLKLGASDLPAAFAALTERP
ncbi:MULTISPECIES: ABC transporter ATP-binding protein [unclassified Chelatococcus]|uniref:ABC transporter ATP-binding protein n=1 Tax=unclassified Chelatococcus TaxID=2638111 RepID=UPI001BCE5292|nr:MULTISPECIES: ABC transporter ATP-binding protein [unclassified Chelatococcus]MBS7700029.1 ATP-binding cassette domain-containing protein [Chelatococcus sp. YT9]MBX3556722.1 ATP-binding cassette domain-containing protein [Chelatococcus sp.]